VPEALAPAYYTALGRGWRRDVWAVLHPPYTAWHLSYAVIGASLAPRLSVFRLVATLLAFFLAVGIAAHSLDELNGRPLRTAIPSWVLKTAGVVGLAGAVFLGLAGVPVIGWGLLLFVALGVLFVFAYNLELLGGHMHGDFWFALSWGAYGQRALSTPARSLRRRTRSVSGMVTMTDGSELPLDEAALLRPLEKALRAFSWGVVALAAGLLASRLL
jgi:hypothetical protein